MGVFAGLEHIVVENEQLARHTWLRLGGPARYFAEPTSFEELATLVNRCRENQIAVKVLGGGSNLLVRESGVNGLVVHLAAPPFCGITIAGSTIKAGAGTKLGHVVATAAREGLAGMEELVGIPGTIGGALHGNAGGDGRDIGQFTASATVLNSAGQLLTRSRKELHFAYRESSLDELLILEAQFELDKAPPAEIVKRMQKLWIVSKSSLPRGYPPAGCLFKSPGGMSATSLLEEARVKDIRSGEVHLSETNLNYVVAKPGATAADVLAVMEQAQARVAERLGVTLEPQIEVW